MEARGAKTRPSLRQVTAQRIMAVTKLKPHNGQCHRLERWPRPRDDEESPVSDTSQGPGWWLASDGKWYPPAAPTSAPPPPPGAYGQQPAPGAIYVQAKPKKKLTRRPLFWILIVVIVFFGGCIGIVAGTANHVAHVADQTHAVVYSVTGTGTGSSSTITYDTTQEGAGQNGESQASDASLPWSKTITASGLFTDFSLSAQNGAGGSITCTITEDGKVLNTNTATGQFAIASCDATGKTN